MHFLLPKKYFSLIITTLGITLAHAFLGTGIQFFELNQAIMRLSNDSPLTINKQIKNPFSTKRDIAFNQNEVNSIQSSPWIQQMGAFDGNNFDADLKSNLLGFRTAIFLESIPAAFIKTERFEWQQGQTVPILIPAQYLNLYNFGFAPSRGMPKLQMENLATVPLQLSLSGNGLRGEYAAKISGPTNGINSILVPVEFMAYANSKYAANPSAPVRLLIHPKAGAWNKCISYLEEEGYEVRTSGFYNPSIERALNFFSFITLLLAFLLIALSLLLSMGYFRSEIFQKKESIQKLYLLGYTPKEIESTYKKTYFQMIITGSVMAILLLCLTYYMIARHFDFETMDFSIYLSPITIIVMIVIPIVELLGISRSISGILQKMYA